MTKELNKETLEEIAAWLDVTDELLIEYANLLEQIKLVQAKGTIEVSIGEGTDRLIGLIRKVCASNEMQDDLREWAKMNLDECPYDCDNCNPDL